MKTIGIYGLAIPDLREVKVSTPCYALVAEELSRGWMSLAGAMGGHTVVVKLLLEFGTEDQRQRYLPRMATGQLRGHHGPHRTARAGQTWPPDHQRHPRRRRLGDHGAKTWISNARRSDLIALAVPHRPGRRSPAHRHQHPARREDRRRP